MSSLMPKAIVMVKGLTRDTTLNGEVGEIQELRTLGDGSPGAKVVLDNGQVKILRLCNLEEVEVEDDEPQEQPAYAPQPHPVYQPAPLPPQPALQQPAPPAPAPAVTVASTPDLLLQLLQQQQAAMARKQEEENARKIEEMRQDIEKEQAAKFQQQLREELKKREEELLKARNANIDEIVKKSIEKEKKALEEQQQAEIQKQLEIIEEQRKKNEVDIAARYDEIVRGAEADAALRLQEKEKQLADKEREMRERQERENEEYRARAAEDVDERIKARLEQELKDLQMRHQQEIAAQNAAQEQQRKAEEGAVEKRRKEILEKAELEAEKTRKEKLEWLAQMEQEMKKQHEEEKKRCLAELDEYKKHAEQEVVDLRSQDVDKLVADQLALHEKRLAEKEVAMRERHEAEALKRQQEFEEMQKKKEEELLSKRDREINELVSKTLEKERALLYSRHEEELEKLRIARLEQERRDAAEAEARRQELLDKAEAEAALVFQEKERQITEKEREMRERQERENEEHRRRAEEEALHLRGQDVENLVQAKLEQELRELQLRHAREIEAQDMAIQAQRQAAEEAAELKRKEMVVKAEEEAAAVAAEQAKRLRQEEDEIRMRHEAEKARAMQEVDDYRRRAASEVDELIRNQDVIDKIVKQELQKESENLKKEAERTLREKEKDLQRRREEEEAVRQEIFEQNRRKSEQEVMRLVNKSLENERILLAELHEQQLNAFRKDAEVTKVQKTHAAETRHKDRMHEIEGRMAELKAAMEIRQTEELGTDSNEDLKAAHAAQQEELFAEHTSALAESDKVLKDELDAILVEISKQEEELLARQKGERIRRLQSTEDLRDVPKDVKLMEPDAVRYYTPPPIDELKKRDLERGIQERQGALNELTTRMQRHQEERFVACQNETMGRRDIREEEHQTWEAIVAFWKHQERTTAQNIKALLKREAAAYKELKSDENTGFQHIVSVKRNEAAARYAFEEKESTARAAIIRDRLQGMEEIVKIRSKQSELRQKYETNEEKPRSRIEAMEVAEWSVILKEKEERWKQDCVSRRKKQQALWVPDKDVAGCEECHKKFTIVRRRHHCRSCGGVFCNACSNVRAAIPVHGHDKKVRVCEPCARNDLWKKDYESPACFSCGVIFGVFKRKHHCRSCGHLFCGPCTRHRVTLLDLGHVGPQRVCASCYPEELAYQEQNGESWASSPRALALGLSFNTPPADLDYESSRVSPLSFMTYTDPHSEQMVKRVVARRQDSLQGHHKKQAIRKARLSTAVLPEASPCSDDTITRRSFEDANSTHEEKPPTPEQPSPPDDALQGSPEDDIVRELEEEDIEAAERSGEAPHTEAVDEAQAHEDIPAAAGNVYSEVVGAHDELPAEHDELPADPTTETADARVTGGTTEAPVEDPLPEGAEASEDKAPQDASVDPEPEQEPSEQEAKPDGECAATDLVQEVTLTSEVQEEGTTVEHALEDAAQVDVTQQIDAAQEHAATQEDVIRNVAQVDAHDGAVQEDAVQMHEASQQGEVQGEHAVQEDAAQEDVVQQVEETAEAAQQDAAVQEDVVQQIEVQGDAVQEHDSVQDLVASWAAEAREQLAQEETVAACNTEQSNEAEVAQEPPARESIEAGHPEASEVAEQVQAEDQVEQEPQLGEQAAVEESKEQEKGNGKGGKGRRNRNQRKKGQRK
eukprot:TRINITY_DN774_c0_g1_i3.p1 TRINITY_DN774_c0_g1~~TRINITY_DN774_c0_g1_i3.p1  ORF type:complete len:1692 (+),score=612.04 TRINITY_DN774_c0_g1_i3:52-5076(+)